MTKIHDDIIFTSMGMFIIDEIHFPKNSGKLSYYNVIGGGGTYGALGSRIITKSKNSSKIGWIVDKGSDFPVEIEDYINKWDTGVIWRNNFERLTTRGWNMYGDRDFREFKYLAPKLRIDVDDLLNYNQLLNSQSFHLICSPQRCHEILKSLKIARKDFKENPPVIVWEPVPDVCVPENLQSCLENLRNVDVLTPNAEEAARFFGIEEPSNFKELEELALKFQPYLTKNSKFNTNSAIVLRCGPLGSYTLTSSGMGKWFPAYHDHINNPNPKVIDPTGGGNTFIGSFTTGFVLSKGNWEVASICGNLGAGIAIEQIGMPIFEKIDDDMDLWNGLSLRERFKNYKNWNNLEIKNEILEIFK
ncbi:hypothetical protein WICMUC_001493 [Wickerhamomyces mucosus]|uniref:Carbohydrate kinase PfkB domain-containing protein n=1 Tax=Wickerhamomyces mucosus TaxID=1378264 RepID=A0A9P8PUC3_9ASCO|nr:hypothetical protein WICMUC_001493 [Wickerhamomyces mucosus]